jgi:hypothetical protein
MPMNIDTYDDDEESDDQEVERPRTPPKPREVMPAGEPYERLIPTAIPEPDPSAGRGDNGGSAPLVPMMPDMPVEPKIQQAMNDQQVSDLFKSQRGARVIQMRSRKGMGDQLVVDPITASASNTVAPMPAVLSPGSTARTAASTASVQAPPATDTSKVAQAQAAAQRAAEEAKRALAVAQAAAREEAVAQDAQAQTAAQQEPEEPYRVPVRRRSSPFVLLGVAAAALFGAVAWSMMETYSKAPGLGEEEEEEEEEEELEVPTLAGIPDVIEGEIVPDEDESDEADETEDEEAA